MESRAALNMIGIAKKAGRLFIGEEPVAAAARDHSARLVIIASDAALNTTRQVRNLPGNAVIMTAPYSKAELGSELGRAVCAVLAVTDARLALSIAEKIASMESVTKDYGAELDELRTRVQRVNKRQAEKTAHEKNKRKGKIGRAGK